MPAVPPPPPPPPGHEGWTDGDGGGGGGEGGGCGKGLFLSLYIIRVLLPTMVQRGCKWVDGSMGGSVDGWQDERMEREMDI